VIRQLESEGLVARNRPKPGDRPGKPRATAENVVFPEMGFRLGEGTDAMEPRSVSEGERPVMTVDRGRQDLFGKPATIPRGSGAPTPELEG